MELKLIIKKLNNQLTPLEEIEFSQWYEESPAHRAYFKKASENFQKDIEVNIEAAWSKMDIQKNSNLKPKNLFYYVAAAVLAAVFGSSLFFQYQDLTIPSSPNFSEKVTKKEDRILLTLENGNEIELESADSIILAGNVVKRGNLLVYNDSSAHDEKWNTITIPRGEIFQLVLSDGTRVWLNSESKLKYPTKFHADAPRKVELVYGEVFFEVTSSRSNKNNFFVQTRSQSIEVLGTEFNVKAYPEETSVETVLAEGKILLKDNPSGNIQYLKPGYQSVYEQNSNIWKIKRVNVDLVTSWRKGTFIFEDMDLESIMNAISRWYDVKVVYKNEAARKGKFNGVFRKNQDLNNILTLLKTTGEVSYNFDGKTIQIQ